ncbi:hypothetical protein FB464_2448 [Subtercola boreus]|nr:hypothetical protein FB464_2448 [Subtercola boreus]
MSPIAIGLRDDTGDTYQWMQAISGGGLMADVRSDVFAGAPPSTAKLLLVTIQNESHPDFTETVIDLAAPFA